MDLTTRYLGRDLPHPFLPGASPLVDDLDAVRRMEDAGAAAIVMHSLFEEQVVGEQMASVRHLDSFEDSFAEAGSFLPRPPRFTLGPDAYLDQIRKIKEAVAVPVFGSLNGSTPGGWLRYARLMEQAGADGLELNVYWLATDPAEDGRSVERQAVEMLRAVKSTVTLPVAVKLSPYYSSLAHFAKSLDDAGADGLVLFNRFYQPDIDVESLEVVRSLRLSDPSELLLRLRWLAILSGRLRADLAVSGGVHGATDAVKAIMAGAHAVQVVSAILLKGPSVLRVLRGGLAAWLEEHEYESLRQMQGSMGLSRCPDPRMFERMNYTQVLQGWNA